MINVAVITCRGGSKSVPKKNIHPIRQKPAVSYPIAAALACPLVDEVYVSTDCPQIKEVAISHGARIIDRPPELSQDNSELVDALLHALEVISSPVRYLIQMHGNSVVHRKGLIEEGIKTLDSHPSLDSCVSGVINRSVHPIRTKKLSKRGLLEPWLEMSGKVSTNRQNLEPCFCLDGAARVLRVSTCFDANRLGQPPYSYMGRNIAPLFNPQGFDIHSFEDIVLAEEILKSREMTG